jgi:hypothetical protein
MAVVWKKLAYEEDVVLKAAYAAYSILAADTDDVPAAIELAASQMIGRKASGGIVALTKSDIQTILNVADGATANAKASAADVETGTDDTKFLTAASIHHADQHQIPHVAPGTSGNVLTSNGTDWTSAAASVAAHALSAHSAAAANADLAGYQLTNQVIHTVANAAARDGLTAVLGKIAFQSDTLAAYLCTSIA